MSKADNPIIDPVIVKHFTDYPLSAFSIYTEGQFMVLKGIGKKIVDALDAAYEDCHFEGKSLHGVHHNPINEAYGLFWLWVLGAFELTRTMSNAKKCFTASILEDLVIFKNHLAIIRMPFTKQQPRGRSEPIKGVALISNIDGEKRDICFSAEGEEFWVRNEIRSFEELVESITINDITATYSASFEL